MLTSLQSLVPVFVYFLIGVVLRRSGIATREHAQFMLRLVFYVTLPALAFTSISSQSLTPGSLLLPVIAFLVNLACALVAVAYARAANLSARVAGAVVLSAGVTNVTFVIPFVEAGLGSAALAAVILYDAGNAIFLATGAYLISAYYGEAGTSPLLASFGKMLRAPLLIAVMTAAVISMAELQVPGYALAILNPLGAATSPLVLIALGALFSTAKLRSGLVYSTVAIRMLGGLLVGLLLVEVFDLQGAAAVAVIAAASAPIGFNATTLASIGQLDTEHATAALLVSVAIGLVTATMIVLWGVRFLAG